MATPPIGEEVKFVGLAQLLHICEVGRIEDIKCSTVLEMELSWEGSLSLKTDAHLYSKCIA